MNFNWAFSLRERTRYLKSYLDFALIDVTVFITNYEKSLESCEPLRVKSLIIITCQVLQKSYRLNHINTVNDII